MEVDTKSKETDPPPTKLNPHTPTNNCLSRVRPPEQNVTRSEPNLNGSQPEPVIVNSVPSLKNLSENCLPEKVSKMHVKNAALNPKLFLQSKSLGVDTRWVF